MTAFLRRFYAGGGASTTLASAMGNSDTSFSISATTGWPGGSPGANFIVVIDRGTSSEEKILCSSNSGTVVSVATSGRGYDGTSATSHNSNATVSLCGGAIDFDETNQMSHLFGSQAEGSLFYAKGAGVLPSALAVGGAGAILTSNGTDPAYVALGTSGYYLTAGASAPQWTALPTIPPVTENFTFGLPSITLSGSPQTVLTSGSLVAGTYLVAGQMNFSNSGATTGINNIGAFIGGATNSSATVYGIGWAQVSAIASGTFNLSIPITTIVTLGSTQNLYLEAINNGGGGGTFVVSTSQDSLLSIVRIS